MLGTKGKTGRIALSSWRNDFEAGNKDVYIVKAMDVGAVLIIRLHNDKSRWIENPDWFVDRLVVTSSTQEKAFLFPCYRWIETDLVIYQGEGNSVDFRSNQKGQEPMSRSIHFH